jgi:hypothetical protein
MMVCGIRDYWVFGFGPSSGILKNTIERNVSEIQYVFSVLRWRGGRHLLCWVRCTELLVHPAWTRYIPFLWEIRTSYRSRDRGQLSLTDPTKQVSPTPHVRTETDPISETLCSLEYRTMEKVQKPTNLKFTSEDSNASNLSHRTRHCFQLALFSSFPNF